MGNISLLVWHTNAKVDKIPGSFFRKNKLNKNKVPEAAVNWIPN